MGEILQLDYYYGIEAEQFSFYRVPRLLIMLMCHKVTHKNLIDSSPLFRYYLTHTPCNFFVKPIDSDTSEEI